MLIWGLEERTDIALEYLRARALVVLPQPLDQLARRPPPGVGVASLDIPPDVCHRNGSLQNTHRDGSDLDGASARNRQRTTVKSA